MPYWKVIDLHDLEHFENGEIQRRFAQFNYELANMVQSVRGMDQNSNAEVTFGESPKPRLHHVGQRRARVEADARLLTQLTPTLSLWKPVLSPTSPPSTRTSFSASAGTPRTSSPVSSSLAGKTSDLWSSGLPSPL